MNLEAVFASPGLRLPIDAAVGLGEDDAPFWGEARVCGEVRNNSGVVSIALSFATVLRFDCDRCAEPVLKDFRGEFTQTLVRSLSGEETSEYLVLPDAQLDLDALVREEMYLQLPPKLLCAEDCKGLCPGCGANLNSGCCTCKQTVDPRLSALLPLLKDNEETP
ncbi:MAG: DUF177 domain-containing protein [Clostridium sp.]|jgi:uncharacterized protein|nr:DUF177 domain-containing protein [Clostridium sp.]